MESIRRTGENNSSGLVQSPQQIKPWRQLLELNKVNSSIRWFLQTQINTT